MPKAYAFPTKYPGREIAPPGFASWSKDEPGEKLEDLSRAMGVWFMDLARVERVFSQHVYQNPKADQWDYRQHRVMLLQFITFGEELAFELAKLKEGFPAAATSFGQVEAKVRELTVLFIQWHAPPDADDLPESCRKGMAEALAGKLVPFKL